MYDAIQTALTVAAEVIAFAGITGIVGHALYTSHRKFMTEFCPSVKPYQAEKEVKVNGEVIISGIEDTEYDDGVTGEYGVEIIEEAVKPKQPEVKPEVETVVTKQPEAVKPRKSRNKKAPQPKLQPMSVGAAAVDYSAMTSEQLRRECALQGIEWRNGGDYGKPMKKVQMLTVLR
jgi:hypothetical protein